MIGPSDKNLPSKLNLELIKRLQDSRTDVFTPKAVYDGRKNLFAVKELKLRNRDDKGQASEEASSMQSPRATVILNFIFHL